MGFWHGPWVRKICKMSVNVGFCALFDEKVCVSNANFAAALFCPQFRLVLGVCQPTKVRGQLLWSIETEHAGKR